MKVASNGKYYLLKAFTTTIQLVLFQQWTFHCLTASPTVLQSFVARTVAVFFVGLKGILCILFQKLWYFNGSKRKPCVGCFPPLFIHPFQPLFISFMVSIFKGFLDVTQLCFLEMVLLPKPAGRCLPGRPSAERLLRSQYIYMAIHLSSIAWGAHKNKGRKKKGNNQERREA